MSVQLRSHPLEYNRERATEDRSLTAILPEGSFSPQWLYKDKNTRGEWKFEEHRRGYDTDTLEDLWGTVENEAEFRCSFYMYLGATFFGVPVPEQVWGPPMKIYRGVLGYSRPMLMITAPDWDQKDHGITKRDNSAQVRIVHSCHVRSLRWERRGPNNVLSGEDRDWDYRMNPHSLAKSRDAHPPYSGISGDYAHLWRGNDPILLDVWKVRDIGNYFMFEHYGRNDYQPNQRTPGWYIVSGPWIHIDIKYGRDSRRLEARSHWNEAFGCQRISHDHVNPWKIYEHSHEHMLWTRYFHKLEIDRSLQYAD